MTNLLHHTSLKHILNVSKVFATNLHFRRSYGKDKKKGPCARQPNTLMKVSCKVALITGGAEGIGLAIAHQILSEKARNVALVGTNACIGRDSIDILNCTYGRGKAIFLQGDVKCPIQLNECFQQVKHEFGRIDIVVNAAGIFNGANWENEVHTNFIGTIRGTLLAYKHMSKEEECGNGGVVLNIAGIHGLEPLGPAPTLSGGYHGIVGFSKSFGSKMNFIRTGVRVVCLCPGITHTGFIKDAGRKALNESMGQDLDVVLCKAKTQKTDVCGKSGVHVMKYGESGSVWVVEGSKLYSVNMPHWKECTVLVSQFI